MHFRLVSLLSILAAGIHCSLANPAAHWGNIRIKHGWRTVPAKWECQGLPPVGTTIDLRIALRPRRKGALIQTLNEVSDIKHPRYGAYLSREQAAELVAPHPETLELVNSWLEHHGVSSSSISRSHGGGWLTVSGVSMSQANKLLGASYKLYRHTETNDTIIRTVRYALPAALHTHVQTVAPTTYFASMRMLHQMPSSRSGGPEASPKGAASREPMNSTALSRRENITPMVSLSELRWMYKTETYEPAAAGNTLGIAGYDTNSPNIRDLEIFMRLYRDDPDDAVFQFDVKFVNYGGFYDKYPALLANIDMQYSYGMAYPVHQTFYAVGGYSLSIPDANHPAGKVNEAHLDWLNYMATLQIPPATLISSYVNDEQTVPLDYARSVCDLFGLLGTRGATVLCPSGNHGVSGIGIDCTVNDGSGRQEFLPTFPSSCPYVTSVGGTSGFEPEAAADLSGGGFSNYFGRPAYQKKEVDIFFGRLGTQHAGKYNDTGRGYPDLSLQALNYKVIHHKRPTFKLNGTNLALSATAGLISLLNDYRIRNGKPRLGFLNPWLYGHGFPALNDIKIGSNPGCGTEGFPALPGWDPVTGLGTPNFQSLVFILDNPDSDEDDE